MSANFVGFLVVLWSVQCFTDRVVESNVGNIRGYLSTHGYYQYLGIPYGQVDKENPFGVSTAYPAFTEEFDANDDSAYCPQTSSSHNNSTLDCLNLNIFTPTTATNTSSLPVLIWIYGGSFLRGRATTDLYGPRFLVRHDIIVVHFNYRVGPYGFMCLDIPEVPGNQGLKDQHLAFQWVKNNIEAFGGNPDEITIFGGSAGGHSVDFHLLSEKEKLYNKAIMSAGSSLAFNALRLSDQNAALRIAEYLELEVTTTREALKALATITPEYVTAAGAELGIPFVPCHEREFEGVEPFITQHWINSTVPKVEGMPILLGFTEFERMANHINEGPDHFASLDIFYRYLNQTFDFDEERLERMEQYMRRFYLGDIPISQESVSGIINFDSDYLYNHPMQRSIKKYLESNAGNIYYYLFAYDGGRNINKITNNVNQPGATHYDETGYLFDNSVFPTTISAADQVIIDRMTLWWTNFVKYGNPTPATTTESPLQWISLTNEIYNYLRIDTETSMLRRPFHKRMAFLDLFFKLNFDYQRDFERPDLVDDNAGDGDSSATISSASFTMIMFILSIVFTLRQ